MLETLYMTLSTEVTNLAKYTTAEFDARAIEV